MTSTTPKLRSPKNWDAWFLALETYARNIRAWEYVDPDTPDRSEDALSEASVRDKLNEEQPVLTISEVDEALIIKERRFDRMIKDYKMRMEPIDAVATWLTTNVDLIA